MEAKVQKWGNSLAIRIPGAFARQAGIRENGPVEITIDGDRLTIRPIVPPAVVLDELLSGITSDNLHGEVDMGQSVGGEEW
ncbi:MAG TPA: AbrB/MazE/SpoVT family DNA-binding domain-containing protein [Myxococcota bacterium]|nr:AbrB/MazE/SpoVT family DNA-binding domain-containing protein [Myxococcota bacterium]